MKVISLLAVLLSLYVSEGYSNPQMYNLHPVLFADSSSLKCPPGYLQPENSNWDKCYKVISGRLMTHDSLIGLCKQTPGGDIVSIHSEEVNNFLMNMPSECPSSEYTIIGLRCSTVKVPGGSTSSCAWDDGTPFDYDNFQKHIPITTPNETTCISMMNSKWDYIMSCNMKVICGICAAPKISSC